MARESDTISSDGRSLRRERNRDAVLDAVIASFEDGDADPSIDAIAHRAGVSNRSIYRYFEHRDQMIRAAVGHAMRAILPTIRLRDVAVGSFAQRVERFVDHQLRSHQRLVPVTQAAKLAAVNEPIVEEEFEAGRLILRRTLLAHFDEEFQPLPPDERARVLIAVELGFQFDSLEFIATATQGRSDEMRAILADHLHRCLGDPLGDRETEMAAIRETSVRSGAESY